jgi:hypothetical protein
MKFLISAGHIVIDIKVKKIVTNPDATLFAPPADNVPC